MNKNIKCKNCLYLYSQTPERKNGRIRFYCAHPKVFKVKDKLAPHIGKWPSFIGYGSRGSYQLETCKTRLKWCPLAYEQEQKRRRSRGVIPMREIKFRAWSKAYSQMLIVTTINFKDNMIVARNLENERPLCLINSSDQFELMQFTGLYDKNGKEIYEGDIVQGFRRLAVVKIGHVHNDKNSIYGVFAEWVKYGLIEAQYIDKIDKGDYIEVIGNIYENKNLLKEK